MKGLLFNEENRGTGRDRLGAAMCRAGGGNRLRGVERAAETYSAVFRCGAVSIWQRVFWRGDVVRINLAVRV